MISSLVSRLIILVFGNLYPAYASYKAVRTKNVKEYVKWMMYWIVFAFFTCMETCTDIFLSWFPFYYELKVLIVVWLLSPATKGSSTLYRKFVHPALTRREQEIDEYLNQAKERGYSAVVQLGSKGVNYATNVIMQTAIKTVQYSLNAANGSSSSRMLTTSQSEGAIYHRSQVIQNNENASDTIDAHCIIRSNSLDAVAAMNMEFSEDEQIDTSPYISELIEDELGAARIREPPARKVKERRTRTKESHAKSNGVTAIRTRRKLRDATPDLDIEVE